MMMTVLGSPMTAMTIAGCHLEGAASEVVYLCLRLYPRCQERRTTFRHRFNCLLSNGSRSPSHYEFSGALGLAARTEMDEMDILRGECDSSKSIDRDTGGEGLRPTTRAILADFGLLAGQWREK